MAVPLLTEVGGGAGVPGGSLLFRRIPPCSVVPDIGLAAPPGSRGLGPAAAAPPRTPSARRVRGFGPAPSPPAPLGVPVPPPPGASVRPPSV
eukprot:CAMPEP_0194313060 /NCGR_PEP_ID=MMETSP0171-20130528/9959_1 /TAXON_ID=218684 /ORGANISM="Corethron pennatum, Strain L29A3" /LENGTH=91 /DNA_ID=CAMNT_0039067845 /DNA_START=297 /DNA_END=568 /DNA_ORIENTATION=+